jgi:septal ring factor EnvC (AmiA/AmiB activator)
MSDSQAYEEVTVTSEGVTVVKRFEEDEFPVPAIAFEFDSAREESVTVRMSDSVPEGIEVEDLGFHPEYGSEFWTIDDDTITFEREIEAGGAYTTVYGIRATGSDNVQQFLTEPVIEEVEPPLPEGESVEGGDVIPESDDDVVKDAIAGDGEIPGLEDDDEDQEESDEDVTLELNDPNNEGQPQADGSADSDGGGGGGGGGSTVALENGSLAGALANEIREQNVSGEDLKLLRRALDVAAKNDGVNEARIEQLQSDISDLRAYTGALEEFLDENGTGDEMIREFETELESFDERLQSVQSEIQSNSEEVDAISETVTQVDEEMDSLSEEVDSVSGEMDSVQDEVTSVSDQLDDLDATIDDLEGQVEELEGKITEGDIASEIEEINQEIEDLQTWQEQIKETFGG